MSIRPPDWIDPTPYNPDDGPPLVVRDPWCPPGRIYLLPGEGPLWEALAVRCMIAGWRW